MTIETFRFSPENGYEDTISFPEPASEEATREQLQRLHGQTRDKLNEVISEFNSLTFPTDEHIIELIKGYSPAGVGKVVASDRNYAEVYLWSDGNPSQEDRLGRFVTLGADGISIASSDSATIGVSVQKADVGFIGGYADGDENNSSKAIVSIMGVANVKTNDNSIVANDRVMSDNNGYAIKSTNNLGYRVLKVISSGLLEIVVSPNTDMVQRIRTDMQSVEADVESLRTEMQNAGGNFIDETNALASTGKVTEYTATEDCYVELKSSWGSNFHYLINGVQIMDNQPSGHRNYFLKSGQTLTAIAADGKTVSFYVNYAFGLK